MQPPFNQIVWKFKLRMRQDTIFINATYIRSLKFLKGINTLSSKAKLKSPRLPNKGPHGVLSACKQASEPDPLPESGQMCHAQPNCSTEMPKKQHSWPSESPLIRWTLGNRRPRSLDMLKKWQKHKSRACHPQLLNLPRRHCPQLQIRNLGPQLQSITVQKKTIMQVSKKYWLFDT